MDMSLIGYCVAVYKHSLTQYNYSPITHYVPSIAAEWCLPQATLVTACSSGISVGLSASLSLPRPSSPNLLMPNEYTSPLSVQATYQSNTTSYNTHTWDYRSTHLTCATSHTPPGLFFCLTDSPPSLETSA